MKQIVFILLALSLAAKAGPRCGKIFVHVSALGDAEFRALVEAGQRESYVNRLAWLTTDVEPQIIIGRGASVETIAQTIQCCGLNVREIRDLLTAALDGRTEGVVPLHHYLETAFKIAAERAGVQCRKNCISTALIHVHHVYTNLAATRNRDKVEHFLQRIGDRSSLAWGDILVLRSKGEVRHVIINLANGLVLHKPGNLGPARVEPLISAMALYHSQRLADWEIWRKRPEAPENLVKTFSPAPRERNFWWWFPLSWGE